MDNLDKQVEVCNEKFKNIFKQLDRMNNILEKIQELTLSINDLSHNIKTIIEKQSKTDKEINTLKTKDLKTWEMIRNCIITGICSAILALIIEHIK